MIILFIVLSFLAAVRFFKLLGFLIEQPQMIKSMLRVCLKNIQIEHQEFKHALNTIINLEA